MSRNAVLLVVLLLLIACSSQVPTTSVQAQPSFANYLVLISLDACRPEYLDLAPLPNLKSLMANGTMYTDAWVGSLVSNTPPGHTVMSTGTFPKTNGILSFTWKNSETGEKVDSTTLEAINRGEMARIVEKSGVPTLAGLIKAQTPDAKIAVVTAHKYYAAQGLGMGPTDYIVYSKRVPKTNPKSRAPTPTPDRTYEPSEGSLIPVALQGHAPAPEVMNDKRLNVMSEKAGDENLFVLNVALALFDKYKPRALLLNLPETDGIGHRTGGMTGLDKVREAMLATDAGIGKLMDAYRAAGIFDQTLWVVTADHGMIPNAKEIDPKTIRTLAQKAGVQGGGGIYVSLNKPAQAVALAEAIAQGQVDGTIGAYAKVKVENQWQYQPAPTTKTTIAASLNDAYLYLLSTFVGATSPDVVMMTAENVGVGTEPLNTKGEHGAVTWGNQHIPLIISGPGIKRGSASNAPARLVDVAPTIARVMNFPTTGMDGVPLADALQNPMPADVTVQDGVTTRLAAPRDALKQMSTMK